MSQERPARRAIPGRKPVFDPPHDETDRKIPATFTITYAGKKDLWSLRRQQTDRWIDRRGHSILIKELADGHLINILRWMHRHIDQFRDAFVLENYVFGLQPSGEGAQIAFNKEMNWAMEHASDEEILDAYFNCYPALVLEAKKRKLSYADPERSVDPGRSCDRKADQQGFRSISSRRLRS